MNYLYIYLLFVNIIAFFTYGLDKRKAAHKRWRIPERTLLGLAALGGALGALLGMRAFHHKTRKPLFKYGVPLLLLVWVGILYYICQ